MSDPTSEWGYNPEFQSAIDNAISSGFLQSLSCFVQNFPEIPWRIQDKIDVVEIERTSKEEELQDRIANLEDRIKSFEERFQDPHEYMKVRVSNFELQF